MAELGREGFKVGGGVTSEGNEMGVSHDRFGGAAAK